MVKHHFIFLPGFMCDERLFDAQLRRLERNGHCCSTADLTKSNSIEGLAQQVLSEAPKLFVPVGLSMGGIVALELYRQAPERISHLALLNTTYHKDRSAIERSRQLSRVQAGELELVLRDELKPRYLHPANRSARRLTLLANMAASLGSDAFKSQTRALMERRSYRSTLSQLSCPTLILAGSEDTVCAPSIQRDMASLIPDSRLVVLPKCGHLSSIEKPDEVSAALLKLVASDRQVSAHSALSKSQLRDLTTCKS